MADDGKPTCASERRRAWCQLLIGQAQIIGATAGFILLLKTGVTNLTLAVIGATLMVSLVSRFYFHSGAAALSRLSMNKYISEFFGTFGLVFAGTGAIVINQVSNGSITHVGIALTFGLIV